MLSRTVLKRNKYTRRHIVRRQYSIPFYGQGRLRNPETCACIGCPPFMPRQGTRVGTDVLYNASLNAPRRRIKCVVGFVPMGLRLRTSSARSSDCCSAENRKKGRSASRQRRIASEQKAAYSRRDNLSANRRHTYEAFQVKKLLYSVLGTPFRERRRPNNNVSKKERKKETAEQRDRSVFLSVRYLRIDASTDQRQSRGLDSTRLKKKLK